MSAHKLPVLLRRGPLSGDINALTNYRWIGRPDAPDILRAADNGKHNVTADFDALVLEYLLDPDAGDMVGILDGVADGQLLTADEKKQVRAFRERFKALVERHNTTGHGRSKSEVAA